MKIILVVYAHSMMTPSHLSCSIKQGGTGAWGVVEQVIYIHCIDFLLDG
jgi:hypothetical protein